MAGWSKEKRQRVEHAFYLFLNRCYINSKDDGRVSLGERLYVGQRRAISEIFDALEQDIHDVYILKSRQLGISTLIRALIIFLLGVHKGLKGAIVFDTDQNKSESRAELEVMINDLPLGLKFPRIKSNNRTGLTLENDSKVLFMAAGVRQTKSSGVLGRSVGLSLAHCSELCSWDNKPGLEAFRNSLSEANPDRLYIFESTARGFNEWWDMWREARADFHHCKCIFLGWYTKPNQRIDRDHPDFLLYGQRPPSEAEMQMIQEVKKLYGYEITVEQLAWYRRKMDPAAILSEDVESDDSSPLKIQEQPSTEQEAFQQTGSIFFGAKALTELTHKFSETPKQKFFFQVGQEFFNTRCHVATTPRNTELKVWEEPEKNCSYVVGIDPAYGHNENNCRSSIQVLKCFADGVDQVAEYAWPMVTTYQLAWVVAALLGWYGSEGSEVRYILELNGPGEAVFNELRSLKTKIEGRLDYAEYAERGLKDIFRNVRTYIWTRADSMGAGYNYHFKCLALDTPLPTPFGWTTIGKVGVGDWVFDDGGNVCSVTGASEVYENKDCYEILFDDGSSIIADAEHLWNVRGSREAWDKEGRVIRTKDLRPGRDVIASVRGLQLPSCDLAIDPYVLGVWLGDGYSDSGRFCAHTDDIEEIGSYIRAAGMELGPRGVAKTHDYQNIIGLYSALRRAHLLGRKHIPDCYLRASYQQRLALLQGLMDTDGTVNAKNGRQCLFVTTSKDIALGFAELLRTLGIKAKSLVSHPTLEYRGRKVDCQPAFHFWFTSYPDTPVFRLKRKLAKTVTNGVFRYRRSRRHHIRSVTRVDSVPVRCIQVDSPSRLYLAGRSMVPTHNTTTQLKITLLERLRDFVSNGLLRVRSLEAIEEMKSVEREGDSIGAPGTKKDDRVMALAMAVHCWEAKARPPLIQRKFTREAEEAKKSVAITDLVALYQKNQLQSFFDRRRIERVGLERQNRYQAWRHAGRRY